ncbi:hypothetical protein [Fusobacterium nucleatum]
MVEIEDSIYKEIKSILEQARNKVYKVANSTMVEAILEYRKSDC